MEKPMQVDLARKRALVTGASTGIGRGIAFGLARCGAAVDVNYSKSFESAREVVQETEKRGGQAVALQADVTEEKQVEDLISNAVEVLGGHDILMANAGGPPEPQPTANISLDEWDKKVSRA
jgi:NAD(P)-dependent dehydrogenase (short-subunit alcohol dehydrogenase family)